MYCGQLLLFLLPRPSTYPLTRVVVALLALAAVGVVVVILMVAVVVAINKTIP